MKIYIDTTLKNIITIYLLGKICSVESLFTGLANGSYHILAYCLSHLLSSLSISSQIFLYMLRSLPKG